ncbi:MAG: DUF3052 domain-containing protein [Marmoricola sp.]
MAGYSGTPLEKKLGIKDGDVVYLDRAPEGFTLEAPTSTRLPKLARITLTFHTAPASLTKRLPTLIEHTEQAGMIWVCWPKKAAAKLGVVSDLDDNLVRGIGLDAGVVDVKICAVDEIWSGMKFVRRLADRA